MITAPGMVLLLLWLLSLRVVAAVVEYVVERRAARRVTAAEKTGFLDGVRSERRFWQGEDAR